MLFYNCRQNKKEVRAKGAIKPGESANDESPPNHLYDILAGQTARQTDRQTDR